MKVVVIGANGVTGQLVVRKLIKHGHQVSGMVHYASQADAIHALGAATRVADLEREETLPKVVADQDVVIFAAGSKGKRLEAVDKNGAINVIDAAKNAGTQRFVMLSSFYAGHPKEGPERIHPYLRAKKAADDHLKASGLDYTIVRPGYLTNDAETGQIEVSKYFHDLKISISRADVAETLVTALEVPESIGKTFEIGTGSLRILDSLMNLA